MKMSIEIEFVSERCIQCGCIFTIPLSHQVNLKRNKNTFYCYNGHGQVYSKSTADILKEENEVLKKRLEAEQWKVDTLTKQLNAPKPKRKALRIPLNKT